VQQGIGPIARDPRGEPACGPGSPGPIERLFICDVSMPRMGGVEMLSLIKGQQRYADLPVVMLTTETRPSLIARARVAGIRAWMLKPVKPDLLLSTVRRIVRLP
jgi:two-component system chemotaxis response regulator CheY